ncbi:MAG: Na+/H+ antiporter NhaA, partial [Actinobacteria bacterium]|nr:Na+/H+ antiporter NhaA [Actinomycetota bacterium]
WLTDGLATEFGILDLKLSVSHWVADGALVIFFFVAGLELRNEVRWGVLRSWRVGLIPAFGALFGMALPALIYLALAKILAGPVSAWGVPMATDLPIALAVLIIFGKGLPIALRGFLLALAIMDDVGSILVIAFRFTESLEFTWLLGAILALFIFYHSTRNLQLGALSFLVALLVWYCTYKSGIHPTVCGVALGMAMPGSHEDDPDKVSAEEALRIWAPISSFLVVPLFIFTALAVPINFNFDNFTDPITVSLLIARLIGKPIGILLGVWLALRITKEKNELVLGDYFIVGILGTLGLSVSLLFAQLSLAGSDLSAATVGVIITLPIAILLAAISLRSRAKYLQR